MTSIKIERVPSGIPGFDRLVEGGFTRRSNVLLRGSTGTGKTLFSLQYLYYGAVKYKEAGLFLSFSEAKDAIYTHATMLGWDLRKLEQDNKFAFIRYSPHEVENIIKEGGGTIRDTIEDIGAKRLVIDSLTAYTLLFESAYKSDESILSLFDILRKWGCTSIVTSEAAASPIDGRFERLGFLSDGIVNLYYLRHKQRRCRALEIIKMRDTSHSERIHGFTISKKTRIKVSGHCTALG